MYRMLFPGGREWALTLSYDDGVSTDIRLIGIMKDHGIRGTFNLNGGLMHGRPRTEGSHITRLTPDEVREVYRGMEIACHGYTHPFMEQVPSDVLVGETVLDRMALEKITGAPVRGMAYPYGTNIPEVRERLKALGIVYSRTTVSTEKFDLPEDFLAWHATCHHRNARLPELCDAFLGAASRRPRLFYLWGHSYEFDDADNWDVIERFCDRMGGKQEIWYATNMEIYHYISAYRALVSTLTGDALYNPTDTDVFLMNRKEEIVRVPAGSTLRTEE